MKVKMQNSAPTRQDMTSIDRPIGKDVGESCDEGQGQENAKI